MAQVFVFFAEKYRYMSFPSAGLADIPYNSIPLNRAAMNSSELFILRLIATNLAVRYICFGCLQQYARWTPRQGVLYG
jgi:hypothetical protein